MADSAPEGRSGVHAAGERDREQVARSNVNFWSSQDCGKLQSIGERRMTSAPKGFSTIKRNWAIVVPFALATLGFWLRRDFAIPPLYGSWLSAATSQLMGADQTAYAGVSYMPAWAWTTVAGLLAALWVRSIDGTNMPSSWQTLRVASNLVLPAVVATAFPWFAWPSSLLIPSIALVIPVLSLVAVICGSLALTCRSRPSQIGLVSCCRDLSWAFFMLALSDWTNLALIGGS